MGLNFKPHFELNIKGRKVIRTNDNRYRIIDMTRDPPKDLGVFNSLEDCKRIINIEERKAPKPKPVIYFEPFTYKDYNITTEQNRYNVWKEQELIGIFYTKKDVTDYIDKRKR